MQLSFNRTILNKIGRILPFFMLAFILFDLITNKKLYFSLDFFSEQSWNLARMMTLLFVIVLMLLNWILESFKWQILTRNYFKLSLKRSFISVWSGVSTAFFTPNRLGDFIGRLSHLPNEHRKKGLVSSAYGSYSQWLLTLIMGWFAWLELGHQFIAHKNLHLSISILTFVILIVLVILFFTKSSMILLKDKWRSHLKHKPEIRERAYLIGLSALRYLVFTFQFYLLLKFFGVNLEYGLVLSKLGMFYLIASFLPSTFYAELGVKESLAVWIFSGLIINSLIIISATFLLWSINLLIPAIVGNYFLYKRKTVNL